MSNLERFIREKHPQFKDSKQLFITCTECKIKTDVKDIIIKDFGQSEVYLCPICKFIIATCNKHRIKKDLSKWYTKEMFIGEEDIKILKDLGLKSKGENDDKEKH